MLNNCYSTYTYRVNRTDDSSSWYEPGQVAHSLHDFIAFHNTQTMYVSYCFHSLLFCCAFASPYTDLCILEFIFYSVMEEQHWQQAVASYSASFWNCLSS